MTNAFSAAPIAVATANIATSSILLQNYSQAISNQPEVTLESVPEFTEDQKSVQQNALFCLNKITPELVALSAQDIGFANEFLQMYPRLLSDAQLIDDATADANARTNATHDFCAGVNQLIITINNGTATRNSMARDLTQFIDLSASNQTDLDADLEVAQKQLLGNDITKLQAQLATIQQAIDSDNQIVASGGVYGVVAGLKIGVAILVGWYKDPAKGFNTILGEIQGIVQESDKHSAALADLTTQNQAYMDTITQLLYDEAVYAVVQNLAFNTDLLAAHAKGAALAVQAYADGWNSLAGSLADIYNRLQKGPTVTLNLAQSLQGAQPEWTSLLAQALAFQQMGIIPIDVKDISNS
ncbi:HBL/NHE enterotoxin family protein [Runella sp. SP2]|uniref:HBL/NHE enterotoxin family protein n=1 Tax=Runella sp. SP2 TaxID=2268026 RepID=UPI000F082BF4|nr:HBL/NHE enterotoxin family protein [Runella sp. SP2]AYQ34252.1 hypothetical protein DTQ70_19755 [Runella sp. SP2]